ncbi:MAG: DUF1491 family protein, partial [Pseudomonadota bacterium]
RALGDLETDDAPPGVDAAFADLGPAARARDSDLWVVEIEDRDGRHFLTERVKIHR